ncbi:hypothetical protein [Robiginitalea aurantiaca]|uniref:Outer membrane protein beta-barrel domain-containing protein n=1 Tax=Robiginitalea aurantiaca TaxID=3056915 RepID=A0ABT7WIM3_9FLAO|nr:hypothetical protein [Robiginitalea aurantiaca]MDM9632779.1 hypothetical protein [Robiginitalea aurantiaca]
MRLLIITLVLLWTTGIQAQPGFKLGLHGGLPINQEGNDAVSLLMGLDTGYLFALGEVVDAGVMVGFINGFPEKFDSGGADLPHIQFLPLAGSFRVWPSRSFSIGADLGYAIGINSGNEGGFYYKPILGYLMGSQTEINLSYTNVDTDFLPWRTVQFGILYTFPQRSRY